MRTGALIPEQLESQPPSSRAKASAFLRRGDFTFGLMIGGHLRARPTRR